MERKEYAKQYRLNNKEKIKQYFSDNKEKIYAGRNKENLRKWRQQNHLKHVEERKKKSKEYRLKNLDKCKLNELNYYYNNKERIKIRGAKYYLKNKKHINERCKIYIKKYLSTPHGKLVWNTLWQKRRALKESTSDGTVTSQFIEGLFIVQDYKCNICGCDITEKYHIDHIYPLSKGGMHTSNNIQLLCPPCNLIKHDKII